MVKSRGIKTKRAPAGLTRWAGGVGQAVARCGRGKAVVNRRRRGTGGRNLGKIRRN